MTRFLVTGASGLLGLNFALQAGREHDVTGVVNHHSLHNAPFPTLPVDLRQPDAIEQLLDDVKPQVVIHCAAMAILDECEADPQRAQQVNASVPGRLAEITKQRGMQLVHISTDSVFDGVKGNYSESDVPNPLSVYARTKLAGEQAVQAANPEALIARTNFYGWSLNGQRSLGEFFYNNLSAGKVVQGFTDVYFCPLLVNDLVDLLIEMVDLHLKGLYHVYSSECLSKYDFGICVARRFGLDESLITPSLYAESKLVAARSPNLTMRTDRLAQALGHPLPDQASGLDRFADLLNGGYADRVQALASPAA